MPDESVSFSASLASLFLATLTAPPASFIRLRNSVIWLTVMPL
jgi:hypothetical protein